MIRVARSKRKTVFFVEMLFYPAHDLVFGIAVRLPFALLDFQVTTAEGQPPMICFLILRQLNMHGLLLLRLRLEMVILTPGHADVTLSKVF
jgi:hypothetical protein